MGFNTILRRNAAASFANEQHYNFLKFGHKWCYKHWPVYRGRRLLYKVFRFTAKIDKHTQCFAFSYWDCWRMTRHQWLHYHVFTVRVYAFHDFIITMCCRYRKQLKLTTYTLYTGLEWMFLCHLRIWFLMSHMARSHEQLSATVMR